MHNSSRVHVVPLERVEALRNSIAHLFAVAITDLDQPVQGHVRFYGRFLVDLPDCFDELRERFEAQGFTPMIRKERDGRVALIALPAVFKVSYPSWYINLVLYIATVLSTLYMGAAFNLETLPVPLSEVWRGWDFSLSIMLILTAHEFGHYFATRYHKAPASLPYFIPLPMSLIGTMGAVIVMKAPLKNKRALFDMGVAGPLAGLVFAIPILLFGLATSEVAVPQSGGILEGNSVLYALAKIVILGRFLPNGSEDVLLNNFAWAGWVGLFVTSLNLIPIGQLDGGHIAYVLFGERARQFFYPILGALVVLSFFSSMWLLWIVLLFFFGRRHAEPLDNVTPLDSRRRALAIFTFILFFLIFVPIPLTQM